MKKALSQTAFAAALVWAVGCRDSAASQSGTDEASENEIGTSQRGDSSGSGNGKPQGDTEAEGD